MPFYKHITLRRIIIDLKLTQVDTRWRLWAMFSKSWRVSWGRGGWSWAATTIIVTDSTVVITTAVSTVTPLLVGSNVSAETRGGQRRFRARIGIVARSWIVVAAQFTASKVANHRRSWQLPTSIVPIIISKNCLLYLKTWWRWWCSTSLCHAAKRGTTRCRGVPRRAITHTRSAAQPDPACSSAALRVCMVDDAARHVTALRRAKLRGKETCRAITHICHLKQIPKLVSFPGFLHV